MISFVWGDHLPLYSARGGTETCTIGQVRELLSRNIDARVITLHLGKKDGREYHPDIPFQDFPSAKSLTELDDLLIFVNFPFKIPTKHPAFVYFHYPPLDRRNYIVNYRSRIGNHKLMVNSRFMRSFWADYFDTSTNKIHIVYPFADPAYGTVKRKPRQPSKTRVLFAGRLLPDKGIFLFLEALHHNIIEPEAYEFNVTTAGNQTSTGRAIEQLLRHHPWVNVIPARHTPEEMAQLYAEHDIVVVPSNHKFWNEAFGMVSVEAQHSGCRVIASNSGGLPETNCGELVLFQPGNSYDLAQKIVKASLAGPLSHEQRAEAIKHFSRASSIDLLLRAIKKEIGPTSYQTLVMGHSKRRASKTPAIPGVRSATSKAGRLL